MSGLTTHVLDTYRGKPAAGLRIELWALDDPAPGKATRAGEPRRLLVETWTGPDGRAVLAGPPPSTASDGEALALTAGLYELVFDIGRYFEGSVPTFWQEIPVRFRVDHPFEHYHVPLLISPWGYTTYRGG